MSQYNIFEKLRRDFGKYIIIEDNGCDQTIVRRRGPGLNYAESDIIGIYSDEQIEDGRVSESEVRAAIEAYLAKNGNHN